MKFGAPLALSASLWLTACKTDKAADRTAVGASRDGSGADFDYYLLSLSWSPEYCHSHPAAPECAAHETFVLHGLWPQRNSGVYSENCSNAPGPSDPSAYKDIYPDEGLLEHEWRAHGTCSGLKPQTYFNNARSAYESVGVPYLLRNLSRQTSMSPDEIVSLFTSGNLAMPRSSVAVSCEKGYLTGVEICLNKDLHPTACQNVPSCAASTVRIAAP